MVSGFTFRRKGRQARFAARTENGAVLETTETRAFSARLGAARMGIDADAGAEGALGASAAAAPRWRWSKGPGVLPLGNRAGRLVQGRGRPGEN